MGLFGTPGTPHYYQPPPTAYPPNIGSSTIALAALEARQWARQQEGQGFDNTIKTSPQGVTSSPGQAPTTLLGK